MTQKTLHDITQSNIDKYSSPTGTSDWTAENDLYPIEKLFIKTYFPPPPARILDIGCGAGRTAAGLKKLGYEVVGFDLSDSLLKFAASHVAGVPFLKMNACFPAFRDNSFDAAVFSYNGLDLVYPESMREKVFVETMRCIRDRGVFYYSSHNLMGKFLRYGFGGLFRNLREHLLFLADQKGPGHIMRGYWYYRESANCWLDFCRSPKYQRKGLVQLGYQPLLIAGTRRHKTRDVLLYSESRPENIDGSSIIGSRYGLNLEITGLDRITRESHHVHYVSRIRKHPPRKQNDERFRDH